MPTALYLDVHVPRAVADQLLRRGADVLSAIEDGADRLPDDELLERAGSARRVLVTFDIRFLAMAEQWQRDGRGFAGLVYAHPLRTSIGQLVTDLEMIAGATDPREWKDAIERLPL